MDIVLNTLYTAGYVGSLFVVPSARTGGGRRDPKTGQLLTRDSPSVIRARMTGVTVASLTSIAALAALAKQRHPGLTPKQLAEVVGLWKPGMTLRQTANLLALPLASTMGLFAGPIYASVLEQTAPGARPWSFKLNVLETLKRLTGLRNYIIGPITEEILFRAAIVGTAALYGRSTRYLVFVTPLYFGIAHAHHAYETYVSGGRSRQALQTGVFRALFQSLYTTLFGWHASFLYLRTGSLIPPILSHVFCNVMGFPNLAAHLHEFPRQRWVILGIYAIGIAAYAKSLWLLTDPKLFGGSRFW